MSLSVRWHRLQASAWLHRLLMLDVALLGLLTAVTCIGGLLLGAPLLWLLPAAGTALMAWLARAWGERRRGSWWAVLILTAPGAVLDLLELGTRPSWWRVVWLLIDGVLLVLLAHPDSTARLASRPEPARTPRWVPERPPPS